MALGLGANLGPAEASLRRAVESLAAALGPLEVAPLYRSHPHSPLPQPAYLNTAVCGSTELAAEAVLAIAKGLELQAGRRPAPRLAPRPLDVDLLLYGDRVSHRPELTLPHPHLARRRFVLAPLAVVAPDFPVPPEGISVRELLARVGQEEEVEEVGWSVAPRLTAPP